MAPFSIILYDFFAEDRIITAVAGAAESCCFAVFLCDGKPCADFFTAGEVRDKEGVFAAGGNIFSLEKIRYEGLPGAQKIGAQVTLFDCSADAGRSFLLRLPPVPRELKAHPLFASAVGEITLPYGAAVAVPRAVAIRLAAAEVPAGTVINSFGEAFGLSLISKPPAFECAVFVPQKSALISQKSDGSRAAQSGGKLYCFNNINSVLHMSDNGSSVEFKITSPSYSLEGAANVGAQRFYRPLEGCAFRHCASAALEFSLHKGKELLLKYRQPASFLGSGRELVESKQPVEAKQHDPAGVKIKS